MSLLAERSSGRMADAMAVAAAALASIALVQFATESLAVSLAFAGGLVVLGLIAFAAARGNPAARTPEAAGMPDWSVTVAAIEQPGIAVAITDRANRLVCGNAAYELWFGSSHAPPRLPVDGASAEGLARAARAAWRDGEGETQAIADEENSWTARVVRAGRGEDYLVWRFAPITKQEPLNAIGKYVTGVFGKILSAAGIEVALVGPDGAIRAASAGFARRAAGDENASMAGQEFSTLLRSDDRDRIYFTREGRKGAPQTLVHVPLAEPGAAPAAADQTPALMLLIDIGVGIGGWGNESRGQSPQLEALLEQLPVGLAMTDRDGHFLFANPAFKRAAGVQGRNLPPYPSDLVVTEDKTAMSDAVRRYGQGPASSGDMAVRLRHQPDEPVSLSLAGVRGLGEAAVLLSLADTTEETRLKRQVAQATKMQAVGQLAGGVARR